MSQEKGLTPQWKGSFKKGRRERATVHELARKSTSHPDKK
jgi:hypothetical protein